MNYIVSGLERSGTSLMMQILEYTNFPIYYDNSRKPDENNPKGYYELFGGKILNEINTLNFDKYDNKCIKITSFGISQLPEDGRKYKIIYMQRPIDEVMKSSKTFNDDCYNIMDKSMKETLIKLNSHTEKYMRDREDIDFINIYHRNLMNNPEEELDRLGKFLDWNVSEGVNAVDKSLWRKRNEEYKNI